MGAILLKIFTAFLPFMKEVILGDASSKAKFDNTVYFMTTLIFIMFVMLNFVKSTAIKMHDELYVANKEITELKTKIEEIKSGNSNCKDKFANYETRLKEQSDIISGLKTALEKNAATDGHQPQQTVINTSTGDLLNKFKNVKE